MPSKTAAFLCVISLISSNAHGSISSRRVPGCPDLEAFQTSSTMDSLSSLQLTKINCLCGPGHPNDEIFAQKETTTNDEEIISITCIYGTKIADLKKTLEFVAKANKSVGRMVLDHVDFSDEEMPNEKEEFLSSPKVGQLTHLEVKKCKGTPKLEFEMNSTAKFDSLVELVIEECNLEKVPMDFLKKGPKLRRISLANNKISKLGRNDFDGVEMLETLNIAGNSLSSSVENGSLSKLINLKNLVIGEHNFASQALLREIGQLKTLESLDMSQIDGIVSTEQFEHFQNMSNLKRLILSGCNLKKLNSDGFSQFPALEWLDVRVNLIEQLMNNSFKGLDNLQFLSLSGNFIKDLPNKLWEDLPALENIEMGWNELKELDGTSFSGMGKRLQRLNLGNNEALKRIEDDTFDGMDELRYLNISGTPLESISAKIFSMPKLKELDLSSSNLTLIEKSLKNETHSNGSSLEWLSLAKNGLKTLDVNLLKEMKTLKMLDLSENRWLCDEQMQKIVTLIDLRYKKAANEQREFELRNSERTECERPFARAGESVFELLAVNASELRYDARKDTTTTHKTEPTTAVTVGPAEGGGGGDFLENSTIDWKSATFFIGSNSDEHLNFSAIENSDEFDGRRPKYDINAVKYGETSPTKKDANSLLSGVVVTLLVISTAFCIIIVARRKEDENEKGRRKSEGKGEDAQRADKRAKDAAHGPEDTNFAVSTF